ncbi:MAG: glycosyl transferase family 2 [Nocardioidaceae bacterium]|nr:glycosyl transferase family 2 [Nocardioidaceae bacterium]
MGSIDGRAARSEAGAEGVPGAQGVPVVLYLAGSGRSGSTLLERMLGMQPSCVNVGEVIELFRKVSVGGERCGCGEPFAQCPFWSRVGETAFGGWSPERMREIATLQRRVGRQRHVPRLLAARFGRSGRLLDRRADQSAFGADLARLGEAYARLYAAVAEVAGAGVVVDASKWPGHGLALARSGAVDLRVIHLVRDPRGVAFSWSKTDVARPQAAGMSGATARMAAHGAGATALRWTAFQLECDALRAVVPYSTRVRYEDLVARPLVTVGEALRTLGLHSAAHDVRHIHHGTVDLSPSHGLSGNPSRFTSGAVRLRLDEAWRQAMPTRTRRLVTTLALPVLITHGYSARGGRTPGRHDEATTVGTAAVGTEPSGARSTGTAAPGAPAPGTAATGTRATGTEDLAGELPLVSVVIPTRGRPDLVELAVRGVVEQDYAGEMECVVVHDQEAPDPALEQLGRDHRRVRAVGNAGSPGLAAARNAGLLHTTGSLVASCDDDDVWHPEKIRLQVQRMVAEPGLLVLGAGIRLLMADDHVVDWPGDSPLITRHQLLRSRRKELHSSTLLIRRTAYTLAGGYDETLPHSYGEDYEWLLRVLPHGGIGVVNQVLADIRKSNPSWFRERSEVVASALEYLLAGHPELAETRPGHARVLGQIAFAHATLGDRRTALRWAARALGRWPIAPHAALAVVVAVTGMSPQVALSVTRRVGRGIT